MCEVEDFEEDFKVEDCRKDKADKNRLKIKLSQILNELEPNIAHFACLQEGGLIFNVILNLLSDSNEQLKKCLQELKLDEPQFTDNTPARERNIIKVLKENYLKQCVYKFLLDNLLQKLKRKIIIFEQNSEQPHQTCPAH